MRTDPKAYETVEVPEQGRKGGSVAAAYPATAAAPGIARSGTAEATYLGMSRATWPAIWAGFFAGLMTYIVLNTLGIALGLTWINNDDVARGTLRGAAGIWLIVTTLASFFVGGSVTARMAAVPGKTTGAMNGLLYAAFAFVLLTVLMVTPLMSLLPHVAPLMAQMGGRDGMEMSTASSGSVQSAAWWTLAGLVAALAAGALGGLCGARPAMIDPLQTDRDIE